MLIEYLEKANCQPFFFKNARREAWPPCCKASALGSALNRLTGESSLGIYGEFARHMGARRPRLSLISGKGMGKGLTIRWSKSAPKGAEAGE